MAGRVVEPGLVEVTYETAADMEVTAQQPIVRLLEAECRARPVALVFLVRNVSRVDLAVPRFWQQVTKRLAPSLRAMAIASKSLAVRTAASTFSVANLLERVPLKVQAFADEQEALAWAREQKSG